jgi:hypothetical protein
MDKMKIEQIFEDSKRIYEAASEIKMLQGDLENMLSAIEKNAVDFQKGRIPKEFFDPTEEKLKKESAMLIKRLNTLVDGGMVLVGKIRSEVRLYEPVKKAKEKANVNNQKNRL